MSARSYDAVLEAFECMTIKSKARDKNPQARSVSLSLRGAGVVNPLSVRSGLVMVWNGIYEGRVYSPIRWSLGPRRETGLPRIS